MHGEQANLVLRFSSTVCKHKYKVPHWVLKVH